MPSLTMTAALALADLASFSTESKNQQQSIIASHREEEEDKLLWSAASTQTEGQQQQPGPRGETPPMAVPEITEESILKAAAAIPKLGEIAAQFSTDSVSLATQTDDLEMLLKPSTTTGGYGTTTTSTSIGQNEDAFTIEAQTQASFAESKLRNSLVKILDAPLNFWNSILSTSQTCQHIF